MLRTDGLVLLLLSLLLCVSSCANKTQQPQPHTKRIAISFDDAPLGDGPLFSGDERTNALIASLAKVHSGPSVIFVTTQGLDSHNGRARIERYVEAGHLIANHSATHQWASRTPVEDYLADIDIAETQLKAFSNRRAWYRFPFLDEGKPREKRDKIREGLAFRGLKNGYVTVDNYDWYLQSKWNAAVKSRLRIDMEALRDIYISMILDAANFYDEAAVEALGHSPAHVLLLHENDLAAEFVDDAITALRNDGWEIISPDVAYADPISKEMPSTLFTNQGQVAALAHEAGLSNTHFDHWGIDKAKIDQRIKTSQVFKGKETRFTEIAPGVWMHTSYKNIPPYGPFPSNGLIVVTNENDAVLIDTAWNEAQTAEIVEWVQEHLQRKLIAAIVTHAHDDKMGGMGVLKRTNIPTFAHPMSNTLAPKRGLLAADHDLLVKPNDDLEVPGLNLPNIAIFYPGPGHSEDNIVININERGVLFGGCLVRPSTSFSLGSTKDATIDVWGHSVDKVATRFPESSIVIPSHGRPGDRSMLAHTSRLTRKKTKE